MNSKFSPVWEDACGHGASYFIDSFSYLENGEILQADLYIWNTPNNYQQVCIRYGNEPHEYYSPAPQSLITGQLPIYRAALGVLVRQRHGQFQWVNLKELEDDENQTDS